MKKILSLLLSLLMLISLLAMPVSAGADDGFNDGQFGAWGDNDDDNEFNDGQFDEWGDGDQPDTPPVEPPVVPEGPDGSKAHPYPIGRPVDVPTSLELKAGTCVYYQFPALKFNGWTLTGFALTGIEVDDVMHTELSLMDRAIKITLSGEGNIVGFYNDSEEDVTATLTLEEPLGSSLAPYRLEAGENSIAIPEMHYEFYAEYTTAVPGVHTFEVANYTDFEVLFDSNRYEDTDELIPMTETLTLELEGGIPVAYILRPINGVFNTTLTITPPAKGTEKNPYYLGSYGELLDGVEYMGDAMWPATMDGVYYTVDGYTFNNTTLLVTGKAPLTVTVNGISWTKTGDGEVTAEIPLELIGDEYNFRMQIKSSDSVKLDAVFPVGSEHNPQQLNKGQNTLPLPADSVVYYATYTAEKDGVLIMKPNTTNGLGYTEAENLFSGAYDYIFIDPEGLSSSEDNVLTIAVAAGDIVKITSCSILENDDFELLAMDLILTVAYEGENAVTITKEPATAAYAKEGDKVSVKITAKGDGLKYQWYIKNDGATKYTKSSITSATYSATMSDKVHGRRIYCVVTDQYGNKVQSKTFMLRRQVTITKEPATAAYAQNGKKVSVKITAKGDGLKYQWYIKNDGATKYTKSSITSATYSATMSSKVKGRRVYCVVTDKYGKKVQSKTFLLRESVSITTQPKTATYAKNGATAKVTVKASGDGLKYTWYIKNDGASKYSKSSVTSATYSVKMASKVHNRRLYCVITDKYGNTVKTVTVILKKK